MYKCLRRQGRIKHLLPAVRTMKLTMDEFKEHFESASRNRYEDSPEVIERAVKEKWI